MVIDAIIVTRPSIRLPTYRVTSLAIRTSLEQTNKQHVLITLYCMVRYPRRGMAIAYTCIKPKEI